MYEWYEGHTRAHVLTHSHTHVSVSLSLSLSLHVVKRGVGGRFNFDVTGGAEALMLPRVVLKPMGDPVYVTPARLQTGDEIIAVNNVQVGHSTAFFVQSFSPQGCGVLSALQRRKAEGGCFIHTILQSGSLLIFALFL